ncbi:uncharacterized protein LOC119585323 [Penaeus monodon]|uniref:uncharacterized protein LOC119585323 n=1 Tax=Penaeus monodon TaxID=6687 RepID=UPI0018A77CE9|nr:uncharacterized protein LOC119585323 [Penaeus monodon]
MVHIQYERIRDTGNSERLGRSETRRFNGRQSEGPNEEQINSIAIPPASTTSTHHSQLQTRAHNASSSLPLQPEDQFRDRQDSICSLDYSAAAALAQSASCQRTSRPRLMKTPNSLGVSNLWPRRVSASSRSCSDERSELSEFSVRSDSTQSEQGHPAEIAMLSVNSIYSLAESGSLPSPGSSRLSLRSEISHGQSLYASSQPIVRSNSTSVPCSEKSPSFRLTVPAGTTYHLPYLPEPVPKLSFTQKLAFPTLVQNSIDRPKPRDPYMEAEHNMNTFAKIITIVVLALVTVLVLGVLYKLLH